MAASSTAVRIGRTPNTEELPAPSAEIFTASLAEGKIPHKAKGQQLAGDEGLLLEGKREYKLIVRKFIIRRNANVVNQNMVKNVNENFLANIAQFVPHIE